MTKHRLSLFDFVYSQNFAARRAPLGNGSGPLLTSSSDQQQIFGKFYAGGMAWLRIAQTETEFHAAPSQSVCLFLVASGGV